MQKMRSDLLKPIQALSFILLSFSVCAQEQHTIDSLVTQLNVAKEDSNKVKLYVDIIKNYVYDKQQDGLAYEKPALDLAEKIKWMPGLARIKMWVGRIYWRLGNFDEALKHHLEALQIFTREGNERSSGNTLMYMGQDHVDAGHYPEALNCFLQALKKFEALGDNLKMATIYELLAFTHGNMGNYVEVSKYEYDALRIHEQQGTKGNIASDFSNIAENYANLENYADALKYYLKSIEVN
jgi:tetratricopeptide (TPR) repeat protein